MDQFIESANIGSSPAISRKVFFQLCFTVSCRFFLIVLILISASINIFTQSSLPFKAVKYLSLILHVLRFYVVYLPLYKALRKNFWPTQLHKQGWVPWKED